MAHEADNAWSDILHYHFREFLELFFPEVHRDIDWKRPAEPLDAALEALIPQSLKGKSTADKLFKVWLKSGEEIVVFIHVEIQGYSDLAFAVRMLRYNTRIRERYGSAVVSLAVLTDPSARFRPSAYEYARWGFRLGMEFPTVKLLDYRGRERELERSRNIFSVVVLAHLAALAARKGPTRARRFEAKWRLFKLLYRRGYSRQAVRDLVRFLDWILRLPEELEREIIERARSLEPRKTMPFLSNIERWAIEKGLKQGHEKGYKEGRAEGREEGREEGQEEGLRKGLLEAIALGLECRFGKRGLKVLPRVRKIQDLEKLRWVVAEVNKTPRLEDFLEALDRR
jgi:hypothetical protein